MIEWTIFFLVFLCFSFETKRGDGAWLVEVDIHSSNYYSYYNMGEFIHCATGISNNIRKAICE